MKLRKVISGGQTGADRAGLECAKALGLETGGTAPKNYRIDGGYDPTLKDFGVVESPFWEYKPRTRKNVQDADLTLWFGNIGSPGYWCTKKAADDYKKPFIVNPSAAELRELANTYEVINVAGNRASKNPKVIESVETAFKGLK